MADGWSIYPDDVNISANGVVTFTANTGSDKHYTIYYRSGKYCGKFEVDQEGSAPTPPVTDCVAGTWSTTTQTNTVLSNAYGCTNENTNWKGGGSLTVKIKNDSSYYIPFNGEIKIKASPDINHHFRVPSKEESASSSHYWYGRTTSEGQDSNFLVPPHTTATLTGCTGSFERGTYHFYISILKGDDYKLHAEDLSDSSEVSVSYENNMVIFTIPSSIDGTRWRGDNIETSYGYGQKGNFHYALTLNEVTGNTHCSRFDYQSKNKFGVWEQKVRIVPLHLDISEVNWSAIKTALTEKDANGNYNLNGYYPYTIKEN